MGRGGRGYVGVWCKFTFECGLRCKPRGSFERSDRTDYTSFPFLWKIVPQCIREYISINFLKFSLRYTSSRCYSKQVEYYGILRDSFVLVRYFSHGCPSKHMHRYLGRLRFIVCKQVCRAFRPSVPPFPSSFLVPLLPRTINIHEYDFFVSPIFLILSRLVALLP